MIPAGCCLVSLFWTFSFCESILCSLCVTLARNDSGTPQRKVVLAQDARTRRLTHSLPGHESKAIICCRSDSDYLFRYVCTQPDLDVIAHEAT